MLRPGLLAAILLVLGCESSAPPPDAATDASGPCAEDRDCDDGLFCSGTERCAPDDPASDARGCLDRGSPCEATQRCDESADRCFTMCAVTEDADGDGARAPECGGLDCDDADAEAHPGAVEICDPAGRDEDCDGDTLGDRDLDADGAIDAACCNGERCGTDCDDSAPDRRPGQIEACNEADDDCDGAIDEGVQRLFFPDLDGDGYGDRAGTPTRLCGLAPGVAENALDCNDALAEAAPGRSERCALGPDGAAVDEDCDGAIDETLAVALECASRYGSPPHTGFECAAGACLVAPCPMGWGDCDAEPSNGCETDLTDTVDHCGMCARSCGAGGECVAGGCDQAVDVAAGNGFTCARRERAGVPTTTVCWGANDLGQLGDGTTRGRMTPVVVEGMVGAIELAVSGFPTFPGGPDSRSAPFACARTSEHVVFCWGSNEFGQLGRGTTGGISVTAAPAIGLPDTYFQLTTGSYVRGTIFAMELGAAHAVTFEHTNAMAGINDVGQIWGGTTSGVAASSTPTATTAVNVDLYSRGFDVAGGGSHTCFSEVENCPTFGCSATAIVTCVGSRNDGYQLGSTDTALRSNRIRFSSEVQEIDGGLMFTCARSSGRVSCWGDDTEGELGDGTAGGQSATPITVLAPVGTTPLTDAVQVTAGSFHACARRMDGQVVCWGATGLGGTGTRARDVGLTDVVDVSAGANHTCAVRANGEVWCWGANGSGQLGDGTTTTSTVPVRVTGL